MSAPAGAGLTGSPVAPFAARHIGPRGDDVTAMLGTIGYPSLDALIDDQGFSVEDEQDGERTTIARAEMSRVRKALDRLDESYRDVILLRFTEGLPPKEIAKITGLSENVVSVRIHRGVEKLRILLGPQDAAKDKKQV